MKKSALTAFIKEEILGTLSESPSTEEIKMAKQAVARFMKYRNVGQDEAIRDLENALDTLKQLEESTEEEIEKTKELKAAIDDLAKAKKEAGLSEEEDAPAGDIEVEKKVSKQDKIIKDFQRISTQMKTHLEMFKDAEGEDAKKAAKQMLKKLTPEYQAAKEKYEKLKKIK
jgi:seryl-tRNA synthetase